MPLGSLEPLQGRLVITAAQRLQGTRRQRPRQGRRGAPRSAAPEPTDLRIKAAGSLATELTSTVDKVVNTRTLAKAPGCSSARVRYSSAFRRPRSARSNRLRSTGQGTSMQPRSPFDEIHGLLEMVLRRL